jgi:hypothetical protein
MLHDHGHIPAKLLAPNGAAALTIGTPVLFSSVAHGAAFDIAGQNRADPAAMVEAITRLAGRRRRAPPTEKTDGPQPVSVSRVTAAPAARRAGAAAPCRVLLQVIVV